MRLLIVGTLGGQLTTASKIAMQRGAQVTHAEDAEGALKVLRSGRGADLLMVDVKLDIAALLASLADERIHVPIVACGVETDARAAVAAIRAGAKEYIPLPPDPEMIAAVLAAVAQERGDLIYRDEAMAAVVKLASGTVLELDRKVGEAIDLYVNDRLVARGEVVLVEDKLGVTMTEIIKAERS